MGLDLFVAFAIGPPELVDVRSAIRQIGGQTLN